MRVRWENEKEGERERKGESSADCRRKVPSIGTLAGFIFVGAH